MSMSLLKYQNRREQPRFFRAGILLLEDRSIRDEFLTTGAAFSKSRRVTPDEAMRRPYRPAAEFFDGRSTGAGSRF